MGRNPQDPASTPPVKRFGERAGSSLFGMFGDGNHQSRHAREHAEHVRAHLEAT